MRRSKFDKEQITAILQEQETGAIKSHSRWNQPLDAELVLHETNNVTYRDFEHVRRSGER